MLFPAEGSCLHVSISAVCCPTFPMNFARLLGISIIFSYRILVLGLLTGTCAWIWLLVTLLTYSRHTLTSGPWWVALVLVLFLSLACTNCFLCVSLAQSDLQAHTVWVRVKALKQRWTDEKKKNSILLRLCSSMPCVSLWIAGHKPCAPCSHYRCLSPAVPSLSLTPYGPLCMFECMMPVPAPLPSDLQITTLSSLIFPSEEY